MKSYETDTVKCQFSVIWPSPHETVVRAACFPVSSVFQQLAHSESKQEQEQHVYHTEASVQYMSASFVNCYNIVNRGGDQSAVKQGYLSSHMQDPTWVNGGADSRYTSKGLSFDCPPTDFLLIQPK